MQSGFVFSSWVIEYLFQNESSSIFLVPCSQIILSGRPYVFICSRSVSCLAVPLCLSLYLIGHRFAFRAEGVQKSVKPVPPSPPGVPLASLMKDISYLPFLPSSSHLWEICKANQLCVFFHVIFQTSVIVLFVTPLSLTLPRRCTWWPSASSGSGRDGHCMSCRLLIAD